jgi:glycosyltransferase involved in cell wall biosynthesis
MSPKPIRILRIIARLNIGGPSIQAVSLTHAFSNAYFQTMLVCGKVGSNEGDMSYLAKSNNIEPFYIPELGREIFFGNDFQAFWKLRKIIKQFRPHIIHTHTAKAGSLGRLAALSLRLFSRRNLKNVKLVHTFHGHVFHGYFNKTKSSLFILIERFLSTFTDRIIVISPQQKQDICGKYKIANPRKVTVIPLGFDLIPFIRKTHGEKIKKKYLPNDPRNVLLIGIIGRLTHIKNHHMLLNAVKILKSDKKDHLFRFFIIGDGELRHELMAYTRELGIQDTVFFTGWQKDMPAFYNVLDVVVVTSFNEGTPVTLIEAMAAGKPVVATDVGGIPDLLGFNVKSDLNDYLITPYGILIPSGKSAILAKALLFIFENRDMSNKITQRARDFVLKQYSLQRLVKDMKTLYAELILNN